MNDDGDNTDCDGVAGDDLECVDGFRNHINLAWQLLNDLECEDVDGDDVHGDALEGDNVDGFKKQINRSSLAVAQLAALCILSHSQLCPPAPAAAEFDQIDISSKVKT